MTRQLFEQCKKAYENSIKGYQKALEHLNTAQKEGKTAELSRATLAHQIGEEWAKQAKDLLKQLLRELK